jgi:flagella basal body P-ring formation protein FlgA
MGVEGMEKREKKRNQNQKVSEKAEQGKALEKGYKGQSIRVVMDSSRKIVEGIVIDGETVEIPGN